MSIKSVQDLHNLAKKGNAFKKYVINRLKGLEKDPSWDEVRQMGDPSVFLITAARVNPDIRNKLREIIPGIIKEEIGKIDKETEFDPMLLSRAIHISELFRFVEVFDTLYSFLFHPVGNNIPTATVIDLDILVFRAIASLQDSLENRKEYIKTWETLFKQDNMARYAQVLWTILCAASPERAWDNIDRLFDWNSLPENSVDIEQSLVFLWMKCSLPSRNFKLKLDESLKNTDNIKKTNYSHKFKKIIDNVLSKIQRLEPVSYNDATIVEISRNKQMGVLSWSQPMIHFATG